MRGTKLNTLLVMSMFLPAMVGTTFAGQIFVDANSPAVEEPAYTAPLEYVENEIIVKFRENVADAIEISLAEGALGNELKLSNSLDKLNNKYRLRNAKAVFTNFNERRQQVKALLKKDKALLTRKEKHILKRLKRAPRNATVPDLSRIYKLEVELEEGQSLGEAVAAYNEDRDVEYAELNYIVSICAIPNEPFYPLQWSLNNIGQYYPSSGYYGLPPGTPDCDIDAPEAWDVNTGSSEIIVAVIDTGVDYTHRDLQANMWTDSNGYHGYDFVNNDNDPTDDNGHGTHCAGIIAAQGNNGLDIAGVCWNVRIMAIKFLGLGGSGSASDAVKAFYYAVENGADVTSNSWGGYFPFETLEEAINYAYSQGVVTVAAAGNADSSLPHYPAYYEHVIAVAATNSHDQKASFSNYGDWVDIAAPGVDILSLRASGTSGGTIYDDYTTVASGTSMACPHVSGACAMLLSIDCGLSVDQVQNALMQTTDPIASAICASGRLNVYGAMLRTLGPQGTVWLDSDVYSCSGLIQIKLFDTDLNSNATQQVTVSADGADSETVLLTETSPILDIFVGTITTTSGTANPEDGELQLSHGETITATYYDVNDGSGNPAIVTDTAIADCQGPLIFDVEIDIPGPEPTVTFQTEQATTARVLYSKACGDPNCMVATDLILTTSHVVKLSALSPETDYFFIVEANDAVGNQTIDDNASWCYAFTTDAPGDIYVPAQYHTIQEAIDRSWDGGTVWVTDGIYTGEGNRDIDFKGRVVTVRSENGPQNCIIDCEGTKLNPHRGFYFHSGEDANSVVSGFTITNAYAFGRSYEDRSGGAIRCDNSSPTITNCTFIANAGDWDAGAINNIYSNPTITNCTFYKNSAVENDGGAINNDHSSPTIINCTFSANSAYDWGGAIRNIYSSEPIITNCIFTGNRADDGGGMFYWRNCSPTITNCTFAQNSARNGNTLACDSRYQNYPSNIQLTNCILDDGRNEIHNNDASTITITYSDVRGGYGGEGNIDADPCFVEPGYWGDANDPNIIVEPNDPNAVWVEGDYHLLPGSPCIDAGDNNSVPADTYDFDGDGNTTEPIPFDLDGNPRFVDYPNVPDTGNGTPPIVDMGAYELFHAIEVPMKFTPQALNPGSKGKWVKAHFVLPEGFAVEDVDTNSPAKIIEPFYMESEYMNVFINEDGLVEIEAAFDRAEFCGNGPVEGTIKVIGVLTTGQYFCGTDTIKIINNSFEYLAVLASHWLQTDCGSPDWCGGLDLDQDSVVNFVDFAMFDDCCIEFTGQ